MSATAYQCFRPSESGQTAFRRPVQIFGVPLHRAGGGYGLRRF
ncbi:MULTISPECIES: hypothetical protein [Neisseria]|nr:hypothetical protein [Neisseria sp. WF04]